MHKINVGSLCPLFSCKDDQGNDHSLSDYTGQWLVLYFYPKNNTPFCTQEAQQFNAHYDEFKQLNTEILGISRHSITHHQKFKHKLGLQFPLLADHNASVCHAFSVLSSHPILKKTPFGIKRCTYLINPTGRVSYIWPKVCVKDHARAVLKQLRLSRAAME
jgi:peroxiredoxin Q/BCP